MGGIALRDAGQASAPARKAPRAHTGPQKGQSRVGIAEESFFETKSTVLTNVGSKMMSVRRNGDLLVLAKAWRSQAAGDVAMS